MKHQAETARTRVSFEFFPPKTAEMEQTLWQAIERLAPLQPNFVSVTYGAGGTTRERTHATVKRILAETMLTPAAHLTCVGATRAEIDEVIEAYADAGVRHIVALRGDPPAGIGERFSPHPAGYRNAADLVGGIKRIADVEVSVSAYPEKHPDSATVAADIDMLKAKIDAGASRAITQFFFENDLYFRYLDKVRPAGIQIPIVPGILPVQNFIQTKNFAARAGASVPNWLASRFRRPRSRPGDAQAHRGHRCRRAGHEACRPWRQRFPFLHHEPCRPCVRHMSPPRIAAQPPIRRARARRNGAGLSRTQ